MEYVLKSTICKWNADNHRVARNVDGTVTTMLWDEENILLETDGADSTQVVYTLEPQVYGNVISERRLESGLWVPKSYHFDALGSTRNLTDTNETVTDTWLFDAWGNIVSHTGTSSPPFLWIGEVQYYYDPETGLFTIRVRIYGPTISRWLSVDPLGFEDGRSLYLYAMNNPLSHIDPSGLKVHVFAWEGTLGTGLKILPGLPPIFAINSALKNFYKPIVDSYPDAVWHYTSQKTFNPFGFSRDIQEVKKVALNPEPDYPCCFPRIVFIGYSWGGRSAALAVKKLSEEPDPTHRIIIDAVFAIDPVLGRWKWLSLIHI